jgi:hypothetical protein
MKIEMNGGTFDKIFRSECTWLIRKEFDKEFENNNCIMMEYCSRECI